MPPSIHLNLVRGRRVDLPVATPSSKIKRELVDYETISSQVPSSSRTSERRLYLVPRMSGAP